LYLKGNESKDEVIKNLTRRFPTLLTSPAVPETPAFRVGDLIKPQKEGDADGKLLLTMFFDSLGEMLTEMDGIKSRFQKKIGNAINKKPDYLKKLKVILGAEDPNEAPIPREIVDEDKELRATRTEIPRVLLLGETGVGKTLFANYLEQSGKRVTRLSIAEFIDKEDMLEYELFGYAKGSYSGALNKGYEGLLQGNRGGILFLDEIGTATHTIQAKLLAFLDDFMVRPRGLSHSFFCPILIVAATNEDVYNATDNEESRYRQDLFQRFTDVHRIPPLRDMKNNLDYLVDIMLQNESINIDRRIETVGKDALSALMKLEYQTGNFRELMNRLRWACKTAHKNGRSYLISQDITAYPEPGKFNPSA
ncbi:MAG: sigma 54-interacting transcriptional regulator, partial [Kiritimatiellae bacterium]|nr:sigma 54-interacting transcriptional regulator [Kiritimatiellia bacterium]